MERTYRTMAQQSPADADRWGMMAAICRLRRLDLVRQWLEMRTMIVRTEGRVTQCTLGK